MYGRDTSVWEDIKYQFRYGGMVTKIILVNVAVFVIYGLIGFLDFVTPLALQGLIEKYLFLPADPIGFLKKPWTILTYMFFHAGLLHILFNMLIFYWFSRILQDFVGESKILPIYIFGGLAGGLLFMLAYNTLPPLKEMSAFSSILGASAGVSAIVIAAATIAPNYTIHLIFLGPVRLMYIALFYVLIDIISIPYSNSGGHISHLGGALMGYLFIELLRNGTDLSQGFYKVWDGVTGLFSRDSERPRVVYRNEEKMKETASREGSRRASTAADAGKQERIDAILDKIARSGYESLSKEEKEFLFKVSKED